MNRLLAAFVVAFALAACGLAAAAPPETASDVELYLAELELETPGYERLDARDYGAARVLFLKVRSAA